MTPTVQSTEPIRFYFDYISPYSYIAWTQLDALAARHGRRAEPIAVLFAALLNANGQKGPAEIPSKRAYIFKDVLRKAHRLGVPFSMPPTHPFNPLLALRVSSLPMADELRRSIVDAFFKATWAGGEGIEDPVAVARLLRANGLDGEGLVAEAAGGDTKARLRRQTDEALGLGAFGVPTIVADGELFWGYDAFDVIDDHLGGRGPREPELLDRWANLKASASRVR
jgi:2-hydroxychromene-2-carboxylate isomerase